MIVIPTIIEYLGGEIKEWKESIRQIYGFDNNKNNIKNN